MKLWTNTWLRRACGAAITLACLLPASAAFAEDYGSFAGQVVLDGAIPAEKILIAKGTSAKDPSVCAADGDIVSQGLVVNPKNKGIANVFVYIQKKPDHIHPSLVKSDEPKVNFDQKGCVFTPHCLFVRTDQVVNVLSQDPIPHNTHTNPLRNTQKNDVIKANESKGVEYPNKVTERLPFTVTCDYHPWMKAYWLVLDHPYAAVTDEDGNFKIEKLPVGEHTFTIWQESAGYVEKTYKVKITKDKTTEVTVKADVKKFK